MVKNWLPRGFILSDGLRISKLIAFSDMWQIYYVNNESYTLVVKPNLLERWMVSGLIFANEFIRITAEGKRLYAFIGKKGYMISSVQNGPYPTTNIEANTFAAALRETRNVIENVPLHDALYIEQIVRLLPTYSFTEKLDDKTVLGIWITGGVSISADSFRRLSILLNWMGTDGLKRIITEAGFPRNTASDILEHHEKTRGLEKIRYQGSTIASNGEKFLLPGRPDLETFFNDNIIDILANEGQYKKMGISFPSAIVLHGPPGCGKTYAVERLIEFLDWPSYSIDSGSIGSTYIHETSKKISEIFEKAAANAPSVIVIDEMEAFLIDRSVGRFAGISHIEEVSEFLRRIPEAYKKSVLIIGMTNMLDSIDPAVLRKGRFDITFEVKMPSAEEVKQLLNHLLSKLPVNEDIDLDQLADKLKERPLSDIAFVLKEAGRLAVKQERESIDKDVLLSAAALLSPTKGNNRIGFY